MTSASEDVRRAAGRASIERVDTHHVLLPFPRPLVTGSHRITGLNCVLVEVEAEGLTGIGYAWSNSPRQADAIQSMVLDFADTLRGQNALDVRRHWKDLWDRINFTGQSGIGLLALSAVDTALWDVLAQSAGLPLYRLLGGHSDSLPAYASGGFLSESPEQLADEAVASREAGFTAFKMKVGHRDWRRDVERATVVRVAAGDEMTLFVDANQAWHVTEAIQAARGFAELGVSWLEEPVSAHDLDGAARLCRAEVLPIAAGETVFGKEGAARVLDAGAADILTPMLMRCGGPTQFLQIGALAGARHVPVAPIAFTEISAHLLGACETAVWLEYLPGWWDRLYELPLAIEDGRVRLREAPGLGLRFAADEIARLRV